MKLEFSGQIFEETLSVKFHQNSFSGSRVVPGVRTDRRTDIRKLIVPFHSFAKEPKNLLTS
jgi:hypothetical protein